MNTNITAGTTFIHPVIGTCTVTSTVRKTVRYTDATNYYITTRQALTSLIEAGVVKIAAA